MKIVHAAADENNKARGGMPGDQTGKEIREANFYVKPWDEYLEPLDAELGNKAADIAVIIAAGNYGYSQENRLTGLRSAQEYGVENGIGDFDCSSLVNSCYILAGLKTTERASTKNLAKELLKTGKFARWTDEEHLNGSVWHRGGIWIKRGSHTVICIEPTKGEQPKSVPKVVAKGSVRVRETPVTGKTVAIFHKGDSAEIIGTDKETGWYDIGIGFITNNVRYVERVGE